MKKNTSRGLPAQAGFTLIELLVVVSIMALLLGAGIASYLKFNEKQVLLRDAETVRYLLESARVGIQTGDLGNEACASLDGYQVQAGAGESLITLSVLCRDAAGILLEPAPVISSEILDADTTFTSDVNIIFQPLGKGVEGAGSIELLSQDGYLYSFKISSAGAISMGELSNN